MAVYARKDSRWLAYHWQQVNHAEKESHFTEIAGWQAAEQYAHQDALNYFKRVLALTPHDEVEKQYILYKACLTVYTFTGDKENWQKTLETMSGLIDAGFGDKSEQLEVLYLWIKMYVYTGQLNATETIMPKALDLARSVGDLNIEASILFDWMYLLCLSYQFDEARTKLEESREICERLGTAEAYKKYISNAGVFHFQTGNDWECLHFRLEYLELSKGSGDNLEIATGYANLGGSYLKMGEYDKAWEYLRKALPMAQRAGDVFFEARIHHNSSIILLFLGLYDLAIDSSKSAAAIVKQIGNLYAYNLTLSTLGYLYHKVGELALARETLYQSIALQKELNGGKTVLGGVWYYLGCLLLDLDELEEALKTFRIAEGTLADVSFTNMHLENWAGLALSLSQLGRLEEAFDYAEKVWTHLKESGKEGITGDWDWAQVSVQIYKVFKMRDDLRALDVLQLAYNTLQTRAQKIANPEIRESYLINFPEHAQIAAYMAEELM